MLKSTSTMVLYLWFNRANEGPFYRFMSTSTRIFLSLLYNWATEGAFYMLKSTSTRIFCLCCIIGLLKGPFTC